MLAGSAGMPMRNVPPVLGVAAGAGLDVADTAAVAGFPPAPAASGAELVGGADGDGAGPPQATTMAAPAAGTSSLSADLRDITPYIYVSPPCVFSQSAPHAMAPPAACQPHPATRAR